MQLSELNFSEIKENLKSYIANNSNFTDYDFEGSGLSILLDILAANTYYNAFFHNMAINENFIGTAVKRGSLASIAENFGYTPKGYTSSRMKIIIEIEETNPSKLNGNVITIDKQAIFTVFDSERTYTFTPIKTYSLTSQNGKYIGELELIEGTYIEHTFTAPFDVLIIPNYNIDISTLEVFETNTLNNVTVYEKFKNLKEITPTSPIYYIFETPFQTYKIMFGDGVLGKVPENTSLVKVRYKTSVGEKANGLSNVSYGGTAIDGRFTNSNINYLTVIPSYGGSDPESMNSIRKNILNAYYAQERAVTINDYKYFLEKEYPLASSISVWGGQDNDPPIYGKVFVAIKPKKGFTLSVAEKTRIINEIIKSKNVVTVIPEIVDPEYTFMLISSSVKYDSRKTTLTADDMKIKIISEIERYSEEELGKFNSYFNYSKFITKINQIDPSIIGNITSIYLKKYIPFVPNLSTTYKINFKNAIRERSFKSIIPLKMETDKTINSLLDIYIEDENNSVYAYSITSNGLKTRIKKIGEINYNSGEIEITMNVSNVIGRTDNTMIFTVEPKEYDVNMKYNDILVIDPTDLTIRVIAI